GGDRRFGPGLALGLLAEAGVGGMADGAGGPGGDVAAGQGLPAQRLLGQTLQRHLLPVPFPHGPSPSYGAERETKVLRVPIVRVCRRGWRRSGDMRVIAAGRERGGRRTSAGVAGGGARARGRGGGARARGRTSVPTPDSNLRRLALSGTGARINTTKNARAGRPAPRALRYAARTPAWPRALHCAATTSHGRSRPRIHSLVP